VSLFVDTSVWSLALRRDNPHPGPHVDRLKSAIERGEDIFSTGVVLQELLQGFVGPKSRDLILSHFAALPFIMPDRNDHLAAAELHNTCRRRGVQAGTIDVLLASICIRHKLMMLSADADFDRIAKISDLSVWAAA
jgi:predicted nucleic acid-binding protein